MHKLLALIAALIVTVPNLLAQVPPDFTRMVCVGDIPQDFTRVFSTTYQNDLTKQRSEGGLSKKLSKEYSALSTYFNNQRLQSGLVLYGDPISELCQRIVNKLLANQTTNQSIRVYTIKTNQVNAFSTGEGILYVTIGLISRLENEAQLALILAHEIGHVMKNHSLEQFNNQKDLQSGKSTFRHLNMEEKTMTLFKHARASETEADNIGFDLFTAAAYDPKTAAKTFDILLRSNLALTEIELDWNAYETEYFKIPERWKMPDMDPIKLDEDIDDEMFTHPNIKKRKDMLRTKMADILLKPDTVEYMLSSPQHFKDLRDLARFESINIFIKYGYYPMALYTIMVLKEAYLNHPFLLKAEVMCWSGMQIFSNNAQKSKYSFGYKNYQGQQQAFFYWISKMGKKDVNALAVKVIWEQSSKLDSSDFVTQIRSQSFRELVVNSGWTLDLFRTEPSEPEDSSTSKQSRRQSRNRLCKDAFMVLYQDTLFRNTIQSSFKTYVPKANQYGGDDDEEVAKPDVKEAKDVNFKTASVQKLIMLSPRYFHLDFRKRIEKSVIASDEEEGDLAVRLKMVANLLPIELTVIDDRINKEMTTENMNDYALIVDWLTEESNYKGIDFYTFSSPEIKELSNKFGTNYIGMNVIWTTSELNRFNAGAAVISLMISPTFPLYLYWQIKTMHKTDYAFFVYSTETGNPAFGEYTSTNSKYRRDLINAHLYNSINKLMLK